MGAIDMLMINHESIGKGIQAIRGVYNYIIVKDRNGEILCFSYDMDACEKLIEHHLINEELDRTVFKFEKKTIKNSDAYLGGIMPYKLVLLDKKLVLYRDVMEKAKNHNVKGYKMDKRPKYGLNQYETID
jgi:hypothetical protein